MFNSTLKKEPKSNRNSCTRWRCVYSEPSWAPRSRLMSANVCVMTAVTQPSSYLLMRTINSQAASNQHSETHSPLMQFYWSTSTRRFDASPQFHNSSFCLNWTTRNNIRGVRGSATSPPTSGKPTPAITSRTTAFVRPIVLEAGRLVSSYVSVWAGHQSKHPCSKSSVAGKKKKSKLKWKYWHFIVWLQSVGAFSLLFI